MMRIAIVVSHPIQHFCPQYVSFASNPAVTLRVFFASALGYKKYIDPNFKTEISWGNLNLDRIDHVFMNEDQVITSGPDLDAAGLDDALSDFAPNVLVVYGYYQKLQRRARRWALRNSVKVAYISDSELRHKRNFIKQLLKYFFVRNYFSKISYFFSVGDANEEFYRYYGVPKNRIRRMHFPIDIEQYEKSFSSKPDLRGRIRSRYDISDKRIVLLVVGKLVPWKNQDHIIDAILKGEESGMYVDLFIVGSGFMEGEWKKRVGLMKESRVHFTGFVKIEELPAYYAASDIYVHAASVEPHSIAVSEAIYMGLPVIVSDRCGSYGPTDDVQDGRNGYVYRFGDIDHLSECIDTLAGSQQTREKCGEYSHELAVKFQHQAHYGILNEIVPRAF